MYIYCFWTGSNEMSEARKRSLAQLKSVSELDVILVTKDTLSEYILPEHPFHESFPYLSETHKSDYLRTYFMNFHGGGYSDIKETTGSWLKPYYDFLKSDYLMCGYKEIGPNGVSYEPYRNMWQEMIGCGSFICKPNTPLTNAWYNGMISVLNTKLEEIKLHPSTFPQDCIGSGSGYPIRWSEILGEVFHKLCYEYKNYIIQTLPVLNLNWGYR